MIVAYVGVTNHQHTQASRPTHRRRRQAGQRDDSWIAAPCSIGTLWHSEWLFWSSHAATRQYQPKGQFWSQQQPQFTSPRCAVTEIACRHLRGVERPGTGDRSPSTRVLQAGRVTLSCGQSYSHRSPGVPGDLPRLLTAGGEARCAS